MALTVHTRQCIDSYIFEDYFDTIIAILEEEEELDEQIREAAHAVTIISKIQPVNYYYQCCVLIG